MIKAIMLHITVQLKEAKLRCTSLSISQDSANPATYLFETQFKMKNGA